MKDSHLIPAESPTPATDTSLTRRDFIVQTSAIAAAGIALGALREAEAAQPPKAVADPDLDIAEWSFFWLGVKRAELARGTVINGAQAYVEYQIPTNVRHPYPIVIIHGGGGQGLDWMGTPDGRRGWSTHFLEQGYKVYVVDRPGHGRSPYHTELQGPYRPAATYENMERQFSAPEKSPNRTVTAHLHTQWPGTTGQIGDPSVDQAAAGQGGAFLTDLPATHAIWETLLGELLDRIGPSIVMAHSMGGPSCWIAGNARPQLVKGILAIEPNGPPMGQLQWGVTASPMVYDPPAASPSDLKSVTLPAPKPGYQACRIQAEPARKLKNLAGIPIMLVTAEASYHVPYDWGTVAYLKQAGCNVDHVELANIGIHGNGHFMMMEKNNRDISRVLFNWLDKNVPGNTSAA
jgi:pimeloyl-ACP methyl ester carboxylesterase